MLVLTRKNDDRVYLYNKGTDERIEVVVVEIRRGSVRLGFVAPQNYVIVRNELEDKEKKDDKPVEVPPQG